MMLDVCQATRHVKDVMASCFLNPFPTPEICMAAHLAVATARWP